MDIFGEFRSLQEVIVFAAALSLLCLVIKRIVDQSAVVKGHKYPPSIGSLPVVGSLLYLPDFRDLHHWSLDKSYKLGGVFSFQVGSVYIVVLNSHEAIRQAYVQSSYHYSDRVKHFANYIYNPNGKGLILHPYDEEFKKYHQMSLSILKQFGFGRNIMETRIALEVSEMLDRIRSMNGQAFYPREKFTHAVQSIISRIVFGQPIDPEDRMEKRLMELLYKWGDQFITLLPLDALPALRFLPHFRKFLGEAEKCTKEMFELIDAKIDRSLSPKVEESFVSNFSEKQGTEFDRGQVKVTIRDFIFAGTDTVTSTMMWACVLLANHPAVQERLQKEIDSVVPRDRQPSLSDQSKMNYVEAAILELMRIKTVVPLSTPRITMCDTEICGYFIPKNSQVYSMLHSVHMDVNKWTDPEEFRPERFLDSAGKMIHKDLVIPYSIGKRSCLGESMARQEVFLFLTGLVQQFNILPPEGSERIEYTENKNFIISPNPFEVRFLLRN